MFAPYNPNPRGINTGDCVIRAICRAMEGYDGRTYRDNYSGRMYRDNYSYGNGNMGSRRGYSNLGRYSRDEAKDRLVSEMEGMMNEVSPEAQHAIQRAISALNME